MWYPRWTLHTHTAPFRSVVFIDRYDPPAGGHNKQPCDLAKRKKKIILYYWLVFTSQESLRQECQRQTPSLHQFPVFCSNLWLVDEQENRRDWQWASQQVDRPESNLWMLSLRFRAEGPSAIIRRSIDGDDENTRLLTAAGWLFVYFLFHFYDLASSRVAALRVMCLSVHISHYGAPRCENPWYTYCRASSGGVWMCLLQGSSSFFY